MKKLMAKVLIVLLLFAVPVFAETTTPVDAVTSATAVEYESPTTATPTTYTPTAEQASSLVYTVVSGDVLWKIAVKFKMTTAQLAALNPQVKNINLIYVGQKLYVKPTTATTTTAPTTTTMLDTTKIYEGFGTTLAFRSGPGKDSDGVPVYSFNIAMASATFDAQGRVVNVYIDGYEVSTPNYDGASMPHFSGWPLQSGYNVTDHTTEKVSGVSENTVELAQAEVSGWKTKRERGDSYHMNAANEWYKQMDFFQNFFVGKTIPEIQAWFAKYTTTAGRPIKSTTTNETDLAKYNLLTDAEKASLADVVSGATMSISDAHGDFLGALVNAYNNRIEITISK